MNISKSTSGIILDRTQEQNKVLRNTFMLLGISMFPTIMGALAGIAIDFSFMKDSPLLYSLGTLGLLFGMIFAISKTRDTGMGVVLFLVMTGILGVMLGPVLQVALAMKAGASIITSAAALTGIAFLTLAAIASNSKRDFSWMGKMLFAGLIVILAASIMNIFFQIPSLYLAISSISVLLFSGYILHDVNQIVRGGETNYVMAALAIFLDIYNLFVNILHLLMVFSGDD